MIKAVIFDMDGVLIDTEKYLFRYWKQAATEAGYELSDQILLGMRSLHQSLRFPILRNMWENMRIMQLSAVAEKN